MVASSSSRAATRASSARTWFGFGFGFGFGLGFGFGFGFGLGLDLLLQLVHLCLALVEQLLRRA